MMKGVASHDSNANIWQEATSSIRPGSKLSQSHDLRDGSERWYSTNPPPGGGQIRQLADIPEASPCH
jgi:hypothetical protein